MRQRGHAEVKWLRHYATSQEITGSRPIGGERILFSIYLILAALGPGVHSASNRDEYQKQTNNNVFRE
jgi:hypothetical protein